MVWTTCLQLVQSTATPVLTLTCLLTLSTTLHPDTAPWAYRGTCYPWMSWTTWQWSRTVTRSWCVSHSWCVPAGVSAQCDSSWESSAHTCESSHSWSAPVTMETCFYITYHTSNQQIKELNNVMFQTKQMKTLSSKAIWKIKPIRSSRHGKLIQQLIKQQQVTLVHDHLPGSSLTAKCHLQLLPLTSTTRPKPPTPRVATKRSCLSCKTLFSSVAAVLPPAGVALQARSHVTHTPHKQLRTSLWQPLQATQHLHEKLSHRPENTL